jgi:hypothetical protein
MSVTVQELKQFHRFAENRVQNGSTKLTLEEMLKEFRAYQKETKELQAELQESIEQAKRGEAEPLDIDEIKSEIREQLAQEGIAD